MNAVKETSTETGAGYSAPVLDREEWIRQKKAERAQVFAMMDRAAEKAGKDPERLRTFLELQSRFSGMSVGNVLLLTEQRPGATRVGDWEYWHNCGVYIRRGETGIALIEPGGTYMRKNGSTASVYNVKRVFDISQTSAVSRPDVAPPGDVRKLLMALAANAPVAIVPDEGDGIPEGADARYDSQDGCVHVRTGRPHEAQFRDIVRELAVARLDALGFRRAESAFTAEGAAYIVCRRNGVDTGTFRFDGLAEELGGLEPRHVRMVLGRMRETANGICADMEKPAARPAKEAAVER